MNSQISGQSGFSPAELFLGKPSWRLDFSPEPDLSPSVLSWISDQLLIQEKAISRLQQIRKTALQRKNKGRRHANYAKDDFVLVHKSRWPQRNIPKLESPWFGPFKIVEVRHNSLKVMASPSMGGIITVAYDQCKSWKSVHDPHDDVDDCDFSGAIAADHDAHQFSHDNHIVLSPRAGIVDAERDQAEQDKPEAVKDNSPSTVTDASCNDMFFSLPCLSSLSVRKRPILSGATADSIVNRTRSKSKPFSAVTIPKTDFPAEKESESVSRDKNEFSGDQGPLGEFSENFGTIPPGYSIRTAESAENTVLPEYTPEEAEALGFYNVEAILKHKYHQGWRFLVKWEHFPVSSSTWEPPKSFVLNNGMVNAIFQKYCEDQGLMEVLKRLHKTPRQRMSIFWHNFPCAKQPRT